MKIQVNKEEMKREWVMDKWYQKTTYVIGVVTFWFLALSFTVGFISGLINS